MPTKSGKRQKVTGSMGILSGDGPYPTVSLSFTPLVPLHRQLLGNQLLRMLRFDHEVKQREYSGDIVNTALFSHPRLRQSQADREESK